MTENGNVAKGGKSAIVACRRHFTLVCYIASPTSVLSVLAWICVWIYA